MNYKVFTDTPETLFLGDFREEAQLRPQLNDVIKLGNRPLVFFTITRIEPSPDSVADPDMTPFNYFVRPTNTSIDTAATQGFGDDAIQRKLQRFG